MIGYMVAKAMIPIPLVVVMGRIIFLIQKGLTSSNSLKVLQQRIYMFKKDLLRV